MFKPIFGDSSSSENYQESTSCGSFSSTSASYVDITNLSVSITTTGKRVSIELMADGDTTNRAIFGVAGGDSLFFQIYRDSTVICTTGAIAPSGASVNLPVSSVTFKEKPAAGTYTYKIQGKTSSGSLWSVSRAKLIVYEM